MSVQQHPNAAYQFRGARQLAQLLLQSIGIDRLGNELGRAMLGGATAALVVAVGRHHSSLQGGEAPFDFSEQLQPVHSGHVDGEGCALDSMAERRQTRPQQNHDCLRNFNGLSFMDGH
jgi:hypothetical protein